MKYAKQLREYIIQYIVNKIIININKTVSVNIMSCTYFEIFQTKVSLKKALFVGQVYMFESGRAWPLSTSSWAKLHANAKRGDVLFGVWVFLQNHMFVGGWSDTASARSWLAGRLALRRPAPGGDARPHGSCAPAPSHLRDDWQDYDLHMHHTASICTVMINHPHSLDPP